MTVSPRVVLDDRRLTESDVPNDLRGASLRASRLVDIDLSGRDLRGADLRGVLAQWTTTCLDGARLDGCDLRDADFSGVSARGAVFDHADLEGSRWDRADLRDARFVGARLGWRSIWLADLASGSDSGQPASFDEADLRGADLTGTQLPGASLRRADLRGVRASRAVLTGAQLTAANLADADLAGADLCETDMRDTVLDRADLRDCALLGARMIGTSVDLVRLDRARLGGTTVVLAPGGRPASAHDLVHLGPSAGQKGMLEVAGDAGHGLSTLLVGDQDDPRVARAHRVLESGASSCYRTAPDQLRSPAGPVVTARAYAAHQVAVAVPPATGSDPHWLAPLRRAALDQPPWVSRGLIVVRARHVEVVGALSDDLASLPSDLERDLFDPDPGTADPADPST